MTYLVIGGDDAGDGDAHIGDAGRSLDDGGGDGGADVALQYGAEGAKSGAGGLAGGGAAVVGGGSGARDVSEGFGAYEEGATLRGGECAASREEEEEGGGSECGDG